MDKSSGEQLNKAYEAFRQACMDRQHAEKELQQKTEGYEHQLRQLQEENVTYKNLLFKLQSQQNPGRGNLHQTTHIQENMPEDNEGGPQILRRNDPQFPTPYEQCCEKLKMALQQEKHLKEEIAAERSALKIMEEEFNVKKRQLESVIIDQNKEIRFLRNKLKEVSEHNHPQFLHDMEEKCKTTSHTTRKMLYLPSSGISADQDFAGEELEDVFQEIMGEFDRLRTVARRQTAHLGKLKFNINKDEGQFSMPIQCTDVAAEQTEGPFPPPGKKSTDREMDSTPITARGAGQDEEDPCYVLPLAKLDIKFPPPTDLDFLKSSTDKAIEIETVLKNQPDLDLGEQAMIKPENSSSEPPGVGLNNVVLPESTWDQQIKHPTTLNMLIPTNGDKKQFTNSTEPLVVNPTFIPKGDTTVNMTSAQAAERTVRGPQQPIWMPYLNQDNETLAQGSNICEFCHAVFPAASISKDEFLRHLFLHLEDPSRNGL